MPPRRLVLGLGNDLLGDDGIGLRVVESLRCRPSLAHFDFDTAEGAGLGLLDILAGYQRALIVDCVPADGGPPGQVLRLPPDELAARALTLSSHYAGLPQVLALGRRLGLAMPEVEVLAISVKDPYRIGPGLSPALHRALPSVVAQVERALLEGDRA